MPVYDYQCSDCGYFSDLRPMALAKEPCDCPDCGQSAPRVLISVPNYALMDATMRTAHSTNEQSTHAPKSSKAHGPGCSCCSGSSKSMPSRTLRRPDGSKAFPSARPWMISH